MHDRREVPTPTGSQAELLEGIAAAIEPLAGAGVAALGFGIPSVIDRTTGQSLGSVNIPLEDVALGRVMSERFGVPAAIENDANVATLAEWRLGAGRGRGEPGHAHARHRGRRRGRARTARSSAAGPSSATWSWSRTALRARATAPAAATSRRSRPGTPRIAPPRSSGVRARRPSCSSAGPRRATRRRSRRSPGSAICSAPAIGSFVNVFGAELVIVGGGFGIAAAEFLFPEALEVARREALLESARPRCGSSRRSSARTRA